VSALPPGPWTARFGNGEGYDAITDAWLVEDATGRLLVAVDLGNYGQRAWWGAEEGLEADRIAKHPEAEAVARHIAASGPTS
jgi:hypothetical protein